MKAATQSPEGRGWATIPNAVTLVRLAIVIPTVLLIIDGSAPLLTMILLVLFGVSDWIDGFLARRLGQVSKVGEVLDPIADRVGVAAIVAAFVFAGEIPAWVALLVAGVDVALAVAYAIVKPSQDVKVSMLGKVRTAILMTGIVLIAVSLGPDLQVYAVYGRVLCAFGAVLHLGVGFFYFVAMIRNSRDTSTVETA